MAAGPVRSYSDQPVAMAISARDQCRRYVVAKQSGGVGDVGDPSRAAGVARLLRVAQRRVGTEGGPPQADLLHDESQQLAATAGIVFCNQVLEPILVRA